MDELKPCPFCGGEAEFVRAAVQANGGWTDAVYVRCKVCDARSNRVLYSAKLYPNNEEYTKAAEKFWNRRTAPESPSGKKLIDAGALKHKIEQTYLPSDNLTAGVLHDLISAAPTVDPCAAPENKALTLEELRSAIENKPNGWLWLEALTDSRESLYQRNEITYRWSNITNYGKTWLAYARRPEAAP